MQKIFYTYFSRFQFLITLTVLLLLPLILSPAFTRPYLDTKRAFLNFIIPLGIGTFICTLILSKKFPKHWNYYLLPLSYVIFIFISALFSRNISLSMFHFTQQFFLICGGFWLGFSLYNNRLSMGKVLLTITVVVVFVNIHSFSQFIGRDFLYRFFPWRTVEGELIHYRHIPGTLGNPDFVGGFLMMLSFWMLIASRFFKNNYIFFPLFLITVFVTFITQTRSALLGLFAGILFLLIYFKKYRNVHFNKRFFLITVMSILFTAGFVYIFSLLFADFTEFFLERMHSAFMLLESSFKVRLLHWQLTTEMFLDNWVFGISPGMYRIRYLEYLLDFAGSPEAEPFYNVLRAGGGRLAGEAHNDFFQIFAEYGVFAGAMFFFVLSLFFVSAHRIYTKNLRHGFYLLVFTALMISVLIHAVFSFPFQLYVRAFYIWFTLGIGFSCILQHKYIQNE